MEEEHISLIGVPSNYNMWIFFFWQSGGVGCGLWELVSLTRN